MTLLMVNFARAILALPYPKVKFSVTKCKMSIMVSESVFTWCSESMIEMNEFIIWAWRYCTMNFPKNITGQTHSILFSFASNNKTRLRLYSLHRAMIWFGVGTVERVESIINKPYQCSVFVQNSKFIRKEFFILVEIGT